MSNCGCGPWPAVIDPEFWSVPPNLNANEGSKVEYIEFNLNDTDQQQVVPFRIPKENTSYFFLGHIENLVDTVQQILSFHIINKEVDNMTILLNEIPTSGNYFLKGLIKVSVLS